MLFQDTPARQREILRSEKIKTAFVSKSETKAASFDSYTPRYHSVCRLIRQDGLSAVSINTLPANGGIPFRLNQEIPFSLTAPRGYRQTAFTAFHQPAALCKRPCLPKSSFTHFDCY